MAYRLASERVEVTVDDLTIEVAPVVAWAVAHRATQLALAYYAATTGDGELRALETVYGFFVVEAQPMWQIVDHRGPVLPTAAGMLRLPIDLGLGLVLQWAATVTPKASAVDAVIPPGPLRDEMNERLRVVPKAA